MNDVRDDSERGAKENKNPLKIEIGIGKRQQINKDIAATLKALREVKGFTQKELAEKANMQIAFIAQLEDKKCKKEISIEILAKLLDALDLQLSISIAEKT